MVQQRIGRKTTARTVMARQLRIKKHFSKYMVVQMINENVPVNKAFLFEDTFVWAR